MTFFFCRKSYASKKNFRNKMAASSFVVDETQVYFRRVAMLLKIPGNVFRGFTVS